MIYLTERQEDAWKYLISQAQETKDRKLVVKYAIKTLGKKFKNRWDWYNIIKSLERKRLIVQIGKKHTNTYQLNTEISYKIGIKRTHIPSKLPPGITLEKYGFWGKNQLINEVNKNAKFLHMVCYPTLERIKQAIESFPNLQTIRVIPGNEWILRKSHLQLSKKNNINIITGHHTHRKEIGFFQMNQKKFEKKRELFLNLPLKAEKKWQEMKEYNLSEVEITERYLCINGEKRITMIDLSKEKWMAYQNIEIAILGTLKYLNPQYSTSSKAISIRARGIKIRIESLKKKRKIKEEKVKYEQYTKLPPGLRKNDREKFSTYTEIKNNAPELLENLNSRDQEILELRFSSNSQNSTLILEEIGKKYGIVGERIRQIINNNIDQLRKIYFKHQDYIKKQEILKKVKNKSISLSSVPIEYFDFSVRSYNCLKKHNINNLAELIEKTENYLLNIKNFGTKSLKEIKDKFNQFNLSLKTESEIL